MNKIVLVTGGSRGLGHNMALALAQNGFDIIITYNSKKEAAEALVRQIETGGQKAAALQLQVDETTGYPAFITALQRVLEQVFNTNALYALVNNAGTGSYAPYTETTEEQFDQMVNIHLKSAFFLTQKLLPILQDGGVIINVSSGLARFSLPGNAAYGSMKAGVEALTRYQARELGRRQIRVNVIAPGAIETDFGGGTVRDNPEINQQIAAQTPLGRVGLPDDIGAVVAFLCGDGAKWINGQRIEVSGGIHL